MLDSGVWPFGGLARRDSRASNTALEGQQSRQNQGGLRLAPAAALNTSVLAQKLSRIPGRDRPFAQNFLRF